MPDEERSRNEAAERRAASFYRTHQRRGIREPKESEERGPQSRRGPLEDWFCTQFELSKESGELGANVLSLGALFKVGLRIHRKKENKCWGNPKIAPRRGNI
jgi:hypothetical protein